MTSETPKKKRVVMPWMRKRRRRLLWGREFKVVKKGLDEAQVVAFVDNLIAEHKASQEASAASVYPHLETTVTDAEQMATSIKMKAQEEAEAEAERIISQAKQEAKKINEAEQLATSIKMKAQEEAEAEAERIISQAKQKAKRIRRRAKVAAQKEATGKEIEEPIQLQEEAPEEEIEQPVQLEEEAPKEEIEEAIQLEEEAPEEEIEQPVQLEEEATVSEPVEAAREELLEHLAEEKPGRGETESARLKPDSQTLYAGEVELTIASPVELSLVSRLYNHLQTVPELRILYTRGSWDRGTTITVVLDKPIPLISIISETPGVEVTLELLEKDSLAMGKPGPLPRGEKRGAKGIKLILKEAQPG